MIHQCHCLKCDKDFIRYRTRGNMEICTPCQSNERVRLWKQNNPERVKLHAGYSDNESKRRWAATDAGKANARLRAHRYYWKDPEEARRKSREHYLRNQDKEIQKVVNRNKRIEHATPSWADLDRIAQIYAEARRMTRETGIQYHVDHIIPLHGETVSGFHVEYNLQILTAESNQSKSNRLVL